MIQLYIWEIMKKRSIKPKKLAELMGISQRTIYNIYEGKKSPTISELALMAEILDVGIEDLYDCPQKHRRKK